MRMITTWLMHFRSVHMLTFVLLVHVGCFLVEHALLCFASLQHDELKPLSKTFTDSLSELGNLNVNSFSFENIKNYYSYMDDVTILLLVSARTLTRAL